MTARLARLQGTVAVKLMIARDGSVAEATTETKDPLLIAHPALQSETKQMVQTWTFECLSCAPGTTFKHTIRFNYRLEGADSDYADTKVTLDLPDEVTIVARPPACQDCPHQSVRCRKQASSLIDEKQWDSSGTL